MAAADRFPAGGAMGGGRATGIGVQGAGALMNIIAIRIIGETRLDRQREPRFILFMPGCLPLGATDEPAPVRARHRGFLHL
jgi:hypothetical protein